MVIWNKFIRTVSHLKRTLAELFTPLYWQWCRWVTLGRRNKTLVEIVAWCGFYCPQTRIELVSGIAPIFCYSISERMLKPFDIIMMSVSLDGRWCQTHTVGLVLPKHCFWFVDILDSPHLGPARCSLIILEQQWCWGTDLRRILDPQRNQRGWAGALKLLSS